MSRTHYPHFEVLAEQEAWDQHTRSIVLRRVQSPPERTLLNDHETRTLTALLAHLLYENRDELLAYVLSHFDQRLQSRVGEGERKQNTPQEADLVRRGLAALDAVAAARHNAPFADCRISEQFPILADLQNGKLEQVPELQGVPQKDLFKKLLRLAAEAYASHPMVWSEMGYAGPAYPRGYYRIERGVHDPWEPKMDEPRAPAPNGAAVPHA